MEWLAKGIYTWEPQHPPLARVAVALGPYLSGIRPQGTPHGEILQMFKESAKILNSGKHYDRTLALARVGVLPFFWIACLAVYAWGRRYFSPAVAVVAVFLFFQLHNLCGDYDANPMSANELEVFICCETRFARAESR